MVERRTVLVDMDGVLADFDEGVETELIRRKPSIIIPDPSLHFYIEQRFDDPEDQALVRKIQSEQGFFESLTLMDGAIDGWQRIIEGGHSPRICSAPLRSNIWCTAEKLAWLDANFGPHVADAAIIDKEKWRHDGVALIDDRPEIDESRATWRHIMFTRPANLSAPAEYRINGWHDPTLLTTLALCAERYDRLHG